MTIPLPSIAVLGLLGILVAFTIVSRLVTTFLPLYLLRQGLRASLLPALNLCQLSEFSLVLLQIGAAQGQVSANVANAASLAFAVLAVLSTFAMLHSDTSPERRSSGSSASASVISTTGPPRRSSRTTRRTARRSCCSASIVPRVRWSPSSSVRRPPSTVDLGRRLQPARPRHADARGTKVRYGDISHRDSLLHAGIEDAKIVVSTVPDALLKGTSNLRSCAR